MFENTGVKEKNDAKTFIIYAVVIVCCRIWQHRHLEFENIYRQIKDKNFFKARDMFREMKPKLPADYRYFTEAY
ncbi:hypothetical protein EJ377_02120 [Chryseobacterium arthrosphaerae]|uniref:Uncharacterized protein n=1 Tax=Chryseobacterium arthrosphaerae TaxID=651561 RepID=A0A3S0PRX2_9FLAO|nr:hypothetical protein EJ377_02120 [Chryseobacterium arthrosphaerae]